MRWFTRRRLAALLGALALSSAALVTVSSMSASGGIATSGVFGDYGVVRLHLGNDGDYIRFDKHDGTTFVDGTSVAGHKASLTPSCNLSTGILAMTTAPDRSTLGLFDHAIGVKARGEGSGTPCGRLDGTTQVLTITPKAGGPVAGKLFDFAELDVELKYNATAKAELYLGSTLVYTDTINSTGSDSNPDSGANDNVRWRLPKLSDPPEFFDRVVLRVDASTPSGAVSLEGGGDGTPFINTTTNNDDSLGELLNTRDSLFHVSTVDGTLDCGASTDPEGDESGDGVPETQVSRLQNSSGTCTPIPYAITTTTRTDGTGDVLFQKDLTGQSNAQFTWTVKWEPEADNYPVTSQTRFDPDGNGPITDLIPLKWCDKDESGGNEVPSYGTSPAQLAMKWCLAAQSIVPVSDTQVQITETFYGSGDPRSLH